MMMNSGRSVLDTLGEVRVYTRSRAFVCRLSENRPYTSFASANLQTCADSLMGIGRYNA